jgi:hypothetical protein
MFFFFQLKGGSIRPLVLEAFGGRDLGLDRYDSHPSNFTFWLSSVCLWGESVGMSEGMDQVQPETEFSQVHGYSARLGSSALAPTSGVLIFIVFF